MAQPIYLKLINVAILFCLVAITACTDEKDNANARAANQGPAASATPAEKPQERSKPDPEPGPSEVAENDATTLSKFNKADCSRPATPVVKWVCGDADLSHLLSTVNAASVNTASKLEGSIDLQIHGEIVEIAYKQVTQCVEKDEGKKVCLLSAYNDYYREFDPKGDAIKTPLQATAPALERQRPQSVPSEKPAVSVAKVAGREQDVPRVLACKKSVASTLGTSGSINDIAAQVRRQAAAISECEAMGKGISPQSDGALASVSQQSQASDLARTIGRSRRFNCDRISSDMIMVISRNGWNTPMFHRLLSDANRYGCI